MDLLLKNAVIVTVNPEREIFFHGAMAVDCGRIVAVGDETDVLMAHPTAETVMDLDRKVIFPGFINTHNHLFQTLLKGLGDDMVLSDWLSTMTFPAAQFLEPEDTYYAAMLGCMEGVRSGMTTQLDYMYPHPREGLDDGILRAFKELKIRGIFGRGCMNTGEEFGVCPAIMQDMKTI